MLDKEYYNMPEHAWIMVQVCIYQERGGKKGMKRVIVKTLDMWYTYVVRNWTPVEHIVLNVYERAQTAGNQV